MPHQLYESLSYPLCAALRAVAACALVLSSYAAFGAEPVAMNVRVPAAFHGSSEPVYLHIEEVSLPPGSGGVVRVYADKVEGVVHLDEQHYLGYFALVPKSTREVKAGARKMSVVLPLSLKHERLLDSEEIRVALVVVGVREGVPASSKQLTFKTIYLSDAP